MSWSGGSLPAALAALGPGKLAAADPAGAAAAADLQRLAYHMAMAAGCLGLGSFCAGVLFGMLLRGRGPALGSLCPLAFVVVAGLMLPKGVTEIFPPPAAFVVLALLCALGGLGGWLGQLVAARAGGEPS